MSLFHAAIEDRRQSGGTIACRSYVVSLAGEIGANDIDDVLSYVMFPQPAKEFLQWRKEGGGPERAAAPPTIRRR